MALLSVYSTRGNYRFEVAEGRSVREALDLTDVRVRAACGGTGVCGACVIRLIGGDVSSPTPAEYLKLGPEQRTAGHRLACQLRIKGDAAIRLERPARFSPWKSIPPENLQPLVGCHPDVQSQPLGVAVDLGTTHIRIAVLDRQQGRCIATRYGRNPQGDFGADVLNRLEAARACPKRAAELAKLARGAIVRAVRDILARDIGEVTPMLAEIGQVLIVGNTAMLALLTGHGSDLLLDPANWQQSIDCRPHDLAAWRAHWPFPHAEILPVQPIGGFVGSDLLADVRATGLSDGPGGALLLDIGTNTEIALWDGKILHVTSVAGGPAFEGTGIRHGMPAEPGAIFRIRQEAASYRCETIAGEPAKGFCGSGLVDAVALLLDQGVLKPSGRFAAPVATEGYRFDPTNGRSAITSADIDAFQRAKAATAAAMNQLLAQAGMGWGEVHRLCVCGAFGRTLDIEHAQSVGLLPSLPHGAIELHADAGLAGCEQALLSLQGADYFNELIAKTRLVNLSRVADYEDRYIEQLRLRPMVSGSTVLL
ncbi:putative 2Fe-2S ferredoxin-like [Candidatus Competibacter denitrificans Run_A_D11]|uniref:2Fe-2S ferredoxin-like n=1 Tax=Candidatus Competibacter denitrificans Run_A_D11 TaxID=1400863 RepID=W6MD01_9GAMM|nr:ASKHA domain-containing protein [Candidatus Competibacter denitrificans]CDI04500.1 putative 2Fe-2S ferredoxin-like [Candidatus Competibacter denitrificans Run_A_D11]HAS85798.1 DUF4445 domain-containing protein [Candidatus Competibacteraceae bacterium]HRC70163.1 ASKHA domain-containing protein [Candidatus Competibacter denitrificans]